MLKLSFVRDFFPQYRQFSDFEVTRAAHAKLAPTSDFAQFASAFGGPTEEDPKILQSREYNAKHPDDPIRPEDIGEGSFANDMGHALAAGINDTAAIPFWLA